MNKLGSKKINHTTKKIILRSKPKIIDYENQNNTLKEYLPLLESFSQKDFLNYENLMQRFSSGQGTIENMIKYMDRIGLTNGPCHELSKIRVNNRYVHQKLIQQLRYCWYDYDDLYRDKIKNDPELFWNYMANNLSRTPKERNIHLSEKWQGTEGKTELKKFLKNLYKKQQGKCAISGVPLVLELGKNKPLPNKCSLDRINSNNGYTYQNVWFVAWWVNQMKMDQSMEEFKKRVLLLAESFKKLDNK